MPALEHWKKNVLTQLPDGWNGLRSPYSLAIEDRKHIASRGWLKWLLESCCWPKWWPESWCWWYAWRTASWFPHVLDGSDDHHTAYCSWQKPSMHTFGIKLPISKPEILSAGLIYVSWDLDPDFLARSPEDPSAGTPGEGRRIPSFIMAGDPTVVLIWTALLTLYGPLSLPASPPPPPHHYLYIQTLSYATTLELKHIQ